MKMGDSIVQGRRKVNFPPVLWDWMLALGVGGYPRVGNRNIWT